MVILNLEIWQKKLRGIKECLIEQFDLRTVNSFFQYKDNNYSHEGKIRKNYEFVLIT